VSVPLYVILHQQTNLPSFSWQNAFSTGDNTAVTAPQESLIVSILSAGTFFGALLAAPLADNLGRRWGIISSCAIVFNLGVILQTVTTGSQELFIAGRFFAGLGVGLISAMVPLYQSETSPKWIRGTIVGAYQLAITIGLLLAAIVNYSTKNRSDTGSYRIPIAVQFAWSIIICVGLFLLPETPRFLIKQDKYEEVRLPVPNHGDSERRQD
jgi:SP family sugar:H+ symporter-like MFS transporter